MNRDDFPDLPEIEVKITPGPTPEEDRVLLDHLYAEQRRARARETIARMSERFQHMTISVPVARAMAGRSALSHILAYGAARHAQIERDETEARQRAWALGLDVDAEMRAARAAGETLAVRVGRAWEERHATDMFGMLSPRDGRLALHLDLAHGSTRARRRALATFLPERARRFYDVAAPQWAHEMQPYSMRDPIHDLDRRPRLDPREVVAELVAGVERLRSPVGVVVLPARGVSRVSVDVLRAVRS